MRGQIVFNVNNQMVIAFDKEGTFEEARVKIERLKALAAQLGIPVVFTGDVESHLPDETHKLLHSSGVSHHH